MALKFSYEWHVENAADLSETENSKVYSPVLFASPCHIISHSWKISLEWSSKHPNHYGIFIHNDDTESSHNVFAKFSSFKALTVHNKIVIEGKMIKGYELEKTGRRGCGFFKAISLADCKKESIKTICVDVELKCAIQKTQNSFSDKKKQNSFSDILLKCNSKLYESKDFTDTEIKCGELEFKVHKTVLVSRSPVFEAMFKTELSEKKSNVIDVKNVDPKALELFIKHLYTGADENEEIPTELFSDFLDLSEKYDVPDLKTFCEIQIETTIEVTTAILFLVLAEKYKLIEAKKAVLAYMKNNLKAVRMHDNAQWRDFITNNVDLTLELFAAMDP